MMFQNERFSACMVEYHVMREEVNIRTASNLPLGYAASVAINANRPRQIRLLNNGCSASQLLTFRATWLYRSRLSPATTLAKQKMAPPASGCEANASPQRALFHNDPDIGGRPNTGGAEMTGLVNGPAESLASA
jgi:hypothetical protein